MATSLDLQCLSSTEQSQVEIPSKLRKLVSVNHRLRQKLSVVRVTKKVDSTKSGQDFIESVERLFEQDPGYKSALAAQRVEHEYRNLGKMLEGLTDGISMDCINELALCQAHREPKWNPPPPTTRSDMMWSPFSSECVLPELNSRVQYRSTKQLERYIHLMFQIQYQHLVCLLQQSIISVITKQMESPGLSASDYLQLLRTLCFMTNSKTYPVIVVDTVETDKDSSD
uniref:Uncharacterized protein n=1 Tax=Magallana gigas TaxID=29159 RepID=K1QE89_MAGGI